MFRVVLAVSVLMLSLAQAAHAVDRERLGFGILFTNDVVDGGEDRWRTGSVATSRVWGPTWSGAAPTRLGDILELRIQGEIISPSNLRRADADDRRYAGALSFGLHTHVTRGATEIAIGGDLVFVGPGTQLDEFQSTLHDAFGFTEPTNEVLDNQIENNFRPTLVFEAGQPLTFGNRATLRPFVEARAGVETLARIGFDWTYGDFGAGGLLVREPVAGQRYEAVRSDWTSYSIVAGADVAYVANSTFLPDDSTGPSLEDTRHRLRAGLAWQTDSGFAGFAGVTYLGDEFEGQDEGQFLGSLRVRFHF